MLVIRRPGYQKLKRQSPASSSARPPAARWTVRFGSSGPGWTNPWGGRMASAVAAFAARLWTRAQGPAPSRCPARLAWPDRDRGGIA
jgi:hypothetical protein